MGQLKKHEYMPWNEISRRYINSKPEFYTPDVWRGKATDKKQGSEGVIENINISAALMIAENMYKSLLDRNVCEEQARMVLPQAMLSSWIWSGSIKAVSKMCKLRCASDTQYESRVVANKISDIMKELYPVSWDALMDQDSGTVGK
jgi:thymidylate synthase (FAD)